MNEKDTQDTFAGDGREGGDRADEGLPDEYLEGHDYSPDSAAYANTLRHRALDFSRAAARAAVRLASHGADAGPLAALAFRVSSGLRSLSWHTENAPHSHRLIHQQEHDLMIAELTRLFAGRQVEGLPGTKAEALALLDRLAGVYTTKLSGVQLTLIPLKGVPDDDEREDVSRFLRHGARLRSGADEAERALGEALCCAALVLVKLRVGATEQVSEGDLLDRELYRAAFKGGDDGTSFHLLADEIVKIYGEQERLRRGSSLRLGGHLRRRHRTAL